MTSKLAFKTVFKVVAVILICGAFYGLGWLGNARLGDSDIKLIEDAYDLIAKESLYNEQSDRELTYAAIRGC